MTALISKDEPLNTSMPYVGYLILKRLDASDDERLSLADVAKSLAKAGVKRSRPMMFGLMFLHLAGIVDFKAPYIYKLPQQ